MPNEASPSGNKKLYEFCWTNGRLTTYLLLQPMHRNSWTIREYLCISTKSNFSVIAPEIYLKTLLKTKLIVIQFKIFSWSLASVTYWQAPLLYIQQWANSVEFHSLTWDLLHSLKCRYSTIIIIIIAIKICTVYIYFSFFLSFHTAGHFFQHLQHLR